MGKRTSSPQKKKPPSGNGGGAAAVAVATRQRPPQQPQPPKHQQSPPVNRHLGVVVGGPRRKKQQQLNNNNNSDPYLSNMTASSLSDSHFNHHHTNNNHNPSTTQRGRLGMSSANSSQSSSSQSTRGGKGNNHNNIINNNNKGEPIQSYVSSTSSQSGGTVGSAATHPSQRQQGSVNKLYYTSPRIELPDTKLFPNTPTKRNSLQSVDDRWQTMSEQAGSHRQDSSVLHVSRRHMTPEVLKAGVLPQVANRIRELHLRLEQAEDMLPEWLDVIATKFQNLEHLVLTRDDDDDYNNNTNCASQSPSTQPSRLRRLYILYRLPHLISIDHVPVTNSERRLARPDDPNGHRVGANEEEWLHLGEPPRNSRKKSSNKAANIAAAAASKKGSGESQGKDKKSNAAASRNKSLSNQNHHNRPKPKINSSSRGRQSKQSPADYDGDDDEDYDNDDDDVDYDGMALNQVVSNDEGEGYELDLELADVIQRITEPKRAAARSRSVSPTAAATAGGHMRSRSRGEDQPVDNIMKKHSSKHHPTTPNNRSTPNSKSIHNNSKHGTPKSGKSGGKKLNNGSNKDDVDKMRMELVACDSTVTSTYGYGHWSGACFAPFQVCSSQQRQKTKEAFVERRSNTNGNTISNSNNNNNKHHSGGGKIKKPSLTVEKAAQQLADNYDDDDDGAYNQHAHGLQPLSTSDTNAQSQPSKSYKYSSLVDETVQKQDDKHRRKLFKETQASAASHGGSTLPSSRRSKKYSTMLGELNGDQEGSSSDDDDDDDDGYAPKAGPQHMSVKGAASQKQQVKATAKSPTKVSTKPAQKQARKQSKNQLEEQSILYEDEVGTLTGVSIAVDRDGNSGMSVATIPSVLQRQAAKMTKGEIKNLAARRNLAGVTIDVPPQTPAEARKKPSNKPHGKLKRSQTAPVQPSKSPVNTSSNKKKEKEKSTKKVSPPDSPTKPSRKAKEKIKLEIPELNEPTKSAEPVIPAVALNSMQETMEGNDTMETFDGPTDPEIVAMVLNRLGGQMDPTNWLEPNLLIPSLTPHSNSKAGIPPTTGSNREDPSRRRHSAGGASVASSGNRSAKIYYKVKAKQQQKKERQDKQAAAAPTKSQKQKETTPVTVGAFGNSRSQDTSESSGVRSSGNFNELESRLNSLINNTGSKLTISSIPTSPKSSKLNEKDQKIMEDTVSKLEANYKNILNLHQSTSPTNRRSRARQAKEPQSPSPDPSPDRQRQQPKNIMPSSATDASPLEKLETSMAGLFATIMAQMSPPRRQLTSPISVSNLARKKEKKRDAFFSKESEKTLDRLASDKSNGDDSTLFVLEIQNHDVAESLTHDFGFHPGKDKIHTEAPSVINLVAPSVQSSVTNFPMSPNGTQAALALSPTSAVQLADETRKNANQGQETHVIDLTDKSTIANPSSGNSTDVINLIDVASPQAVQKMKAAWTHDASPTSAGLDTGGNADCPEIGAQESKLGMVVNLPPISEGDSVESVDSYCVAAAAAGAEAGADAPGDNTCANGQSASDFPSVFIPTSNNAGATAGGPNPSLPQEIIAGDNNPIFSMLQVPVTGRDKLPLQSDVPYPREVVVERAGESEMHVEETGLIVDLLTARPKDSRVSLLSRKEPIGYRQSSGYQEEEIVRRDSPPSPKEGGPTLPREILAMLEEREGLLLPVSSEEAMAFLPSEIIMRIQNSFASEDYYDPTQLPLNATGPPQEITSPTLTLPNGYSPSMIEDIRAMLEEYDRKANGFATESDRPACAQGMATSLPSQVAAVQMRSKPAESNFATENDRPTYAQGVAMSLPSQVAVQIQTELYTAPSDEFVVQERSNARMASATNYYGSSTGDSAVDGRNTARPAHSEDPPTSQMKPMSTVPFSRTSPVAARFRRNAGIDHGAASSGYRSSTLPSKVQVVGIGPSSPTKRSEGSFLPHMGSLPSNVVVQQDRSPVRAHNAPVNKAVPPSKSLTSPFPMQFRKPLKVSTTQDDSEVPRQPTSAQGVGASSTTVQNSVSQLASLSMRLVPNQITVDPPPIEHTKPPPSPKNTIEKPSSPSQQIFRKPVASPMFQRRAKKTAARNLPPHNPTSNRRSVSAISPRSEKMTKAMKMWKEQRSARTSSIMDEYDDDDDDENGGDNDDDDEDTGHTGQLVSYSE